MAGIKMENEMQQMTILIAGFQTEVILQILLRAGGNRLCSGL